MEKWWKKDDMNEFYHFFDIPDELLNKLNSDFLNIFKQNLADIFSEKTENSDFNDGKMWLYFEGTAGWFDALKKSTIENEYKEIFEFYTNIKYAYYSDIFDHCITLKAIEEKVIKDF